MKTTMRKTLAVLSTAAFLTGPVFAQDSLYQRQMAGQKSVIEIGEIGKVTINEASVDFRYRIDDSNLASKLERMQSAGILDVTVSIFEDKVALNMQASSGSSFASNFDDTGLLDGEEDINVNLKRLSLVLKPNNQVELEVGSMGAENGVGTENTGIDRDGYIMGYRAKVKFEKGELVVTGGFLGDQNTPNVFDRSVDPTDTDEFNYLSAMLNHQIGKIVTASIGATELDDDIYLHGAMKIDTRQWVQFLDSVAVEATMVDQDGSDDWKQIYGITLAKRFEDILGSRDLEVALGYLHADEGISMPRGTRALDGDSIDIRVTMPNLVEAQNFTVALYAAYLHSLEDSDQSRFETGVRLNF